MRKNISRNIISWTAALFVGLGILFVPGSLRADVLLPLEVICDIAIVALCAWRFKFNHWLVAAFFLLFLADSLYCQKYVSAHQELILFAISEALYTGFLGFAAIFLTLVIVRFYKLSKADVAFMSLSAAIFGSVSFTYVLLPYLNSGMYHTTFFIANSILYRLIETYAFSICMLMSLTVSRRAELLFALGMLLLCISSLALGYNTGVLNGGGIAFHEFGWLYGLILILSAVTESTFGSFTTPLQEHWSSVRTKLVFAIFVPNVLLLTLMLKLRILSVANAFDITTAMFVCYALWFLSCIVAAPLSQRILAIIACIGTDKIRDCGYRIECTVSNKIGILELDQIVSAYNRKVEQNNELVKKIVSESKANENLVALATIGQSTAMIAHDVRKPMSNMKALLSVLPEKRYDDVFIKDAVSQVNDSIRRMEAMMCDMLEFSKKTEMNQDEVDIQVVLSSAIGDVFKNTRETDVSVVYSFGHRCRIYVDETGIARAATNIIDNAVGAMKGLGKIWIETRDLDGADGKQVELIIANNGPMIPIEDIDHLFEPFFTRGKKSGTGLGLAICQKIVTANGGKIDVRNTQERTEFILTLPAGKGEEHIDESQLIHHSREIRDIMPIEPENRSLSEDIGIFLDLHKKRSGASYLLIVDDEPLFRETIRALINRIPEIRDNLKVVEAHSAEVALKLFEAREFDYVISDIEMGRRNMDGYEFANEVLDRYKNALVMIHSNKRIHGKDENLVGRARFQGFLPKPMDEGELMHFLSGKIFEQPRQRGGAMAARIADAQVTPCDTKKLLIVNDEDFMRTALRFQLRKMGGVQVFEAGRVSEAIKILGEEKIDVVFSDINLGEIDNDGYDVLRHAKGHSATIKVYMMSGMQKEDEWPKAQASGADGYIQIPYEEEELKKIVMQ